MKPLLTHLIILLVICCIVHSCIDNTGTNPLPQDNTNYFPGTDGSYYKYEIIEIDTNGFVTNGLRIVHLNGDTLLNRTHYKIQIDSVQTGNQTSESVSYFRNTESGVFYYVDTTGFINTIPDSIQSSIDLQSEMRAYLFPLTAGSSWPVYRVSIRLNDFFSYNLLDISGRYVSDETMELNLLNGVQTVNTKKIEFILEIQTDTINTALTFDAFAWLAGDIGVVKLEGDAVVLSLFGGQLDISDTSATVLQNLIEYDVK